jgi:hypothetical protein
MEDVNKVVLEEESHYCLETISESSITKKQKTFEYEVLFFIENGWKIIDGEVKSVFNLQNSKET